MHATVRLATADDLDEIAEGAEIFEGAISPEAMRRLLVAGEGASISIWAGFINGDLVAVWGALMTSVTADEVHFWLIPHRNLTKHPITFGIAAKLWMRQFCAEMRGVRLTAMVHANHARSLRWLTLLGFRPEDNVVVAGEPQLWLSMETV